MRLLADFRRLLWGVLTLSGVALAASCESASSEPEQGSETHFLRRCDAASCGEGFVCLCGACTRACDESAACTKLAPEAACIDTGPRIATGLCSASDAGSFCDVPCLNDAECASLGELAACEQGFCRVSETDMEPPSPPQCELEDIAPERIVILGDAVLELSGFANELQGVAREAGWLGADEQYRAYASSVTSFLAEVPLGIQTQYAESRNEGPASVVILNGGATDMLQNPCSGSLTPDCPEIRAAALGAERLFSQMAEDGVEHVVYLSYPVLRDRPELNARLDLMRPQIENACGNSAVACHFIDLRPHFEGHDEYLGPDGIVFSQTGARATAITLWGAFDARCIPR